MGISGGRGPKACWEIVTKSAVHITEVGGVVGHSASDFIGPRTSISFRSDRTQYFGTRNPCLSLSGIYDVTTKLCIGLPEVYLFMYPSRHYEH